jgi:hypothetical protein
MTFACTVISTCSIREPVNYLVIKSLDEAFIDDDQAPMMMRGADCFGLCACVGN